MSLACVSSENWFSTKERLAFLHAAMDRVLAPEHVDHILDIYSTEISRLTFERANTEDKAELLALAAKEIERRISYEFAKLKYIEKLKSDITG